VSERVQSLTSSRHSLCNFESRSLN